MLRLLFFFMRMQPPISTPTDILLPHPALFRSLVHGGLGMDDLLSPLPLGIAIGLVLGKPVGIVAAAVLMRVAGFASFPRGMDFRAMLGLGMLCGIGFTMSLFIGSLAFSREPLLYTESVIGVLVASTVSAVIGYAWLRMVLKPQPDGD